MKNVQCLEKVKVQNAFLSVSAFKTTVVSMKASHSNRTVASGWDVVLRVMESVSTKERVDPRMIELRAILLLLKRNLSGSSGQSVRCELKGNNSMSKKGAGPLPVAKCRFIVSSDAATELTIFAFAGHLAIEKGEDAAANVVGMAVWMETKVDDVGLKIVLE